MTQVDATLSTGLPGLDNVFKGLIPGDNIVFEVDSIDDYTPFVGPYCQYALHGGQPLIYFRFAKHPPFVTPSGGVQIHTLHPEEGFEQFVMQIRQVIKDVGRGGYYLFDCLSDLAVDWYSDQMLGNFFLLICPYLYDVGAIAYFPLLRNYHSVYAITPISETAQILLGVIRYQGRLHVHPIKVQQRYSPTMYMLHTWKGEEFVPITQSAMTAEISRTGFSHGRTEFTARNLDVWNHAFLQAEETLSAIQRGETSPERADENFQRLLRMAISRHERMGKLARKYLTLTDVLEIGRRVIGTGLIGGKAVGMLLARAILEVVEPRWAEVLEPHDSFYVGSDVFYTFLVTNGLWWVREQQRDTQSLMRSAEAARQRILVGGFPEHITKQFAEMLDYFGQSPIIVRSSSLLEDNFGNAFAGKYESIFCVNQGPPEKRLDDFLAAVRTIYASTMSEKALSYRVQRKLLDRDEQMALLIQRVSGAIHENLFYPHIAGVGLSFNPYVWNKDIDPAAGVLRLVFALGTRAVERHDDDYTRVVALNAPEKRLESNFDEALRYSQKKADILDLQANQLLTRPVREVITRSCDLPTDMLTSQQEITSSGGRNASPEASAVVLTFEKLLQNTPFVRDMRELLATLQAAYDYPVDIEFTINFLEDGKYKVNLLQCRPFQCASDEDVPELPSALCADDVLLEARGAVIGQSREIHLDRLIYVSPEAYGTLPVPERHRIARLIGQIVHLKEENKPQNVMLLGPGRWGTSSPSLGVPVRFSEISSVSALCEIVAMREGFVPEVSLGTHLFNEMVEMDMLYLALFAHKEGNILNEGFFAKGPNCLGELLPEASKWADVITVLDVPDLKDASSVILNANTLEQRVVCYLKR